MDVAIVGWGHTCFGRPEQDTPQSLIAWAAREALAAAIVPAHAFDSIRLKIFNTGLLAKGHPAGGNRVSSHVMAVRQLTDEALDMQSERIDPDAVFNIGKSGAVSYCSRPGKRKVA